MVRFSKFTQKKEIYEKLEKFLSKLIWRETLFFFLNKVSLQTSLKRNSTNFSYISILSVNFENLTVKLHVVTIFFMHVKFQKDQRSIAISSNKC